MQPFDDHELCNIGERNQHTQKGDFDITKEISLYPNPTTGHVYWTRAQDGPVTVKIFNSLGQLQITRNTTDSHLDLNAFTQAVYRLQILSSENELLFNGKVSLVK